VASLAGSAAQVGSLTLLSRVLGYMLRLGLPYLLFIGLTAFADAILNTYEGLGVPAFTSVLLNLTPGPRLMPFKGGRTQAC
jgi:peptidoglycan biosynthesis protein MviN/MurJ (putative lipid II flippase)